MIKVQSRWQKRRVEVVADFDIPDDKIAVEDEKGTMFTIDARRVLPGDRIQVETGTRHLCHVDSYTVAEITAALATLHENKKVGKNSAWLFDLPT